MVKPQSAFYERFGSRGVAVLERVIATAREAGALVLLDVKRGDIGSTSQAYAEAYLDPASALAADAITVSPFLGFGSLDPFVDTARKHDAGLFVLARTSNKEAPEVQAARVDDEPHGHRHDPRPSPRPQRRCRAARLVRRRGRGHGRRHRRGLRDQRPAARPRLRRPGRHRRRPPADLRFRSPGRAAELLARAAPGRPRPRPRCARPPGVPTTTCARCWREDPPRRPPARAGPCSWPDVLWAGLLRRRRGAPGRAHRRDRAGSPAALLEALPIFRDLADQAPDDIRDDWKTFLDPLEELDDALRDADLDAATYDPKALPADLTDDERERIEAAGAALADPAVVAAFDAVQQQAKDVCHTPLSL